MRGYHKWGVFERDVLQIVKWRLRSHHKTEVRAQQIADYNRSVMRLGGGAIVVRRVTTVTRFRTTYGNVVTPRS
jgi:hypothetical protein